MEEKIINMNQFLGAAQGDQEHSEINMRILSSHLRTVLMVVQLNTMLIIIK